MSRLPDDHIRRRIVVRDFDGVVEQLKKDGHLKDGEGRLMLFGRRLNGLVCEKRIGAQMPRLMKDRSIFPQSQNKWARYRRKCAEEGRCPHCGKECWPFYECEKRRIDKRIRACLYELIRRGEVVRTERGLFEAAPKKKVKFIISPA